MRLIGLICLPEGEKSYSAKQQHEFFVRFNKYLNSDEYRKSAISSLDMYSIKDSGPQFQFLTTLLFHLERKFIEDLSGCLNLQDPESIKSTSVPAEDLPALARGKIRYISGYVLAKLKHNFSVKTVNSLFADRESTKVFELQSQMNILNSWCITYDDLKNSNKDIGSLRETRRRQNERESLTYLTDASFDIFIKLETMCRDKLTHTNLVHHGKSLFSNVIDELYKNTDLFELWVGTLTKNYVVTYDTSGNVKTLEVFYIQLYLLVEAS